MKNPIKPSLFFLLALLLFSLPVNCLAFQHYKPGRLILNNGDTLQGELLVKSEVSNKKSCVFRRDSKAASQEFRPFQIQGFSFDAGRRYESIVLPESQDSIFIRFIMDGVVDLFGWEDAQSSVHYYIRKEGMPFVYLHYFERSKPTVIMDSARIWSNYKSTIYRYTDDCPSIQGQVRLMRDANYHELYRILHRYQGIMKPNEPLMVYERSSNRHPFFEVGYGWNAPSHYALNFFMPAPLLPDFVFMGLGYDTYYGIPIQLRLRFPVFFIQPELGVGIDIFPDFPLVQSLYQWTAGVSVKLGQFSLGCKYSYHFSKWFPLEDKKDLGMTLSYQFN